MGDCVSREKEDKSSGPILHLPTIILDLMCCSLTPKDLSSLAKTCSRLRNEVAEFLRHKLAVLLSQNPQSQQSIHLLTEYEEENTKLLKEGILVAFKDIGNLYKLLVDKSILRFSVITENYLGSSSLLMDHSLNRKVLSVFSEGFSTTFDLNPGVLRFSLRMKIENQCWSKTTSFMLFDDLDILGYGSFQNKKKPSLKKMESIRAQQMTISWDEVDDGEDSRWLRINISKLVMQGRKLDIYWASSVPVSMVFDFIQFEAISE